MSEFGNETATATLKMGEKGIDVLAKLLKYLMERGEHSTDRKYKKEQLRQMKSSSKKEQAREYLNNNRGLIRAKQMFMSGERLIPIGTAMSQNELSRFSRYAKVEGIPFTAIKDERVMEELRQVKKELKELTLTAGTEGLTKDQVNRKKELETKAEELANRRDDQIVIIREKDLEIVKNITDRMNKEINLKNIDRELESLKSLGNDLTDEQKQRIEELQKSKHDILRDEFDSFNSNNNTVITDSLTDKPRWQELSFENAINRVTDREYTQQPCYICERTNPNNYIEAKSSLMEYDGRLFTNTEYRVFHEGVEQRCSEFKHGKFTHYSRKNGENSSAYGDDHWKNMKDEMKEKGGFTNDTLIFSSKEDYLDYKTMFEKEKEVITPQSESVTYQIDNNSYKDYNGIINQLKEQLAGRNLVMNEQGDLCVVANHEPLQLQAGATEESRIDFAEAQNIGKQIVTYTQLNEIQTQLAFIRQQQEMNEHNFEQQGSPDELRGMYNQMREDLHTKNYNATMQIAALEGKVNRLQMEREQLSSIKIVDIVQAKGEEEKAPVSQNRQYVSESEKISDKKSEKVPHGEEKSHVQSMEQWEKEVSQKNTTSAHKTNVKVAEHERK